MRTSICVLVGLIGSAFLVAAKLPPLTVKDVGLMLRTGYSVPAVERELQTRHFIGTVDATTEKTLAESGATPAFLGALKSGAYAVPASEVAAAHAQLAANEQRKAAQAEEGRKLNTLYQHQQAQARAAAAAAPAAVTGSTTPIAALVKGSLVTSKNGVLSVHTDQAFEKKKLIGLYFAGQWCSQCRRFTPQLVEYYNRIAAAHPEFEILFVSSDRSAAAMNAHMSDTQMPWPAVKYETIKDNQELRRYAGSGVPCLVLVDASGKVISDSYAGKTYLGPSKVLADLNKIFAAGKAAGAVALQQ